MKPLTREQTAGTLTFFFPYKRDADTPPEVTLMVRRMSLTEWHAGLAMCSAEDVFSKQVGRKMAFHRLQGFPIRDGNALGLIRQLAKKIETVGKRHPEAIDETTPFQLLNILQRLENMRVE